jgi:hypothetical protein
VQQVENKILSEDDDEKENILGKEKKNVNGIIAWDIFCKDGSTLLQFKVCIILPIIDYHVVH